MLLRLLHFGALKSPNFNEAATSERASSARQEKRSSLLNDQGMSSSEEAKSEEKEDKVASFNQIRENLDYGDSKLD